MALLVGCAEQDYAIVSERDVPSPDGRFVASIMEDTHFNTTGDETHIGLRKAGERRRHPRRVWHFGPGDYVVVAWSSPTNLLVRFCCDGIHGAEPSTNVLGVAVTFQQESLEKMYAERDGTANGSQPVRAQTNQTSGAAGSRR
jgi:hypothetical protein